MTIQYPVRVDLGPRVPREIKLKGKVASKPRALHKAAKNTTSKSQTSSNAQVNGIPKSKSFPSGLSDRIFTDQIERVAAIEEELLRQMPGRFDEKTRLVLECSEECLNEYIQPTVNWLSQAADTLGLSSTFVSSQPEITFTKNDYEKRNDVVPSDPLNELTNAMGPWDHEDSQTRLYCILLNKIAWKLAHGSSDIGVIPPDEEVFMPLMTRGVPDEYSGEINQPDIVIVERGQTVEQKNLTWHKIAAVAEVKVKAELDDETEVEVQLLRYMRKQAQYHPTATSIFGFTLCGTIFRLFASDAQSYTTSNPLDFRRKEHYPEIVKAIALLAGQVSWKEFSWRPQKGMILELTSSETHVLQYEIVEDPDMLDVRGELWGRRTCVHSLEVSRLYQNGRKSAPTTIILKSGWMLPHLCGHESEVMEHIRKTRHELAKDNEGKKLIDSDVVLPKSMGRVSAYRATSEYEPTTFSSFKTSIFRSEQNVAYNQPATFTQLSLLAFRYPQGQLITGSVSTNTLISIYRDIFKGLRQLARLEVHYRDLNTGNILQKRNDESRGFLIDFGNARLQNKPRGQRPEDTEKDADPFMALSLDDNRSANPIMISHRVQEIEQTDLDIRATKKTIAQCNARILGIKGQRKSRKYSATMAAGGISHQERRRANAEVELAKNESKLATLHHRYIDDLESAFYTFLFHALECRETTLTESGSETAIDGLADIKRARTTLISFSQIGIKINHWTIEGNMVRFLESFKYNTSWCTMMLALHGAILSSQIAMNSSKHTSTPGCSKLTAIETKCFDACIEIFDITLLHGRFGLDDSEEEEEVIEPEAEEELVEAEEEEELAEFEEEEELEEEDGPSTREVALQIEFDNLFKRLLLK